MHWNATFVGSGAIKSASQVRTVLCNCCDNGVESSLPSDHRSDSDADYGDDLHARRQSSMEEQAKDINQSINPDFLYWPK